MLQKIYNHPLFLLSFRPFFILTALIAIIVVTLWVSIDFEYFPYYGNILSPARWHGHEMIFGFTLALLAGFILTASSHWSGIKAYRGKPLFILSLLWILERILCFIPVNYWIFFIFTSLFLPYFVFLLNNQLGDNQKNRIIFIPLFIAFFITQKIYHLGLYFDDTMWVNITIDWAINLTKLAIIVVSGRIVPFFIKKKCPEIIITIPSWVNNLAIYSTLLLFIPKELVRVPTFFIIVNLWLLFIHTIRLVLWKPMASYKIPILSVLHSGQLWLLIVFLLDALSYIYPEIKYTRAPLHAFGAGALGIFAIGMMNRVSLGHTGRIIKTSKLMLSAYFCIHLGALIRVLTPIFFPAYFRQSIHHASGWWTLAFIFYLWEFTRILCTKRPDGKDQ